MKRQWPLVIYGVLWLYALAPVPALAGVPKGEWVQTGSSTGAGRILVSLADGTALLFSFRDKQTAAVEQYRPDTGGWTTVGALQALSHPETGTLLPSGLILLTGGDAPVNITELYDPVSNVSTVTGPMHFARTGHQATRLVSGRVLVSGGRGADNHLIGPAEIYDPGTGAWTITGVLNQLRGQHAAVALPDGRVLAAGGVGVSGALASAEIYDPGTGRWTVATAMDQSGVAGIALSDGRVLVAGDGTSQAYDSTTDTWSSKAALGFEPTRLVGLNDGTPLAARLRGFCIVCNFSPVAALLDLESGQWTGTSSPPIGKAPYGISGPMALLSNGRVLLAAGESLQAGESHLFVTDNTTARLVVSPSSVDLGATSPSVPLQQAVTLLNGGDATLEGTATTSPPFGVVAGAPFAIPPGAAATVTVQFAPPGFGSFQGALRITSSGGARSVALSGFAGVGLFGRVTDASGAGVGSVPVSLTGAGTSGTTTDESGQYRLFVGPNNGYNITPAGAGLTFAPGSRAVVVGDRDVAGLDFTTGAAPSSNIDVFVTGLYQTVFGHAPDPGGAAYWTGALRQSCDSAGFARALDAFFDSNEFRSRALTPNDLVTVLHRVVLGRAPEPAELAAWVGVFRSNREALSATFASSPEFRSLLPDRTNRSAVTALVTRLYAVILGRTPEASEVTAWTDDIVSTQDVEATVSAFVGSREFEQRPVTTHHYVDTLYRSILGRIPSVGESGYWEGTLQSQLRQILDGSLIPSAEFQTRIAGLCGSQ